MRILDCVPDRTSFSRVVVPPISSASSATPSWPILFAADKKNKQCAGNHLLVFGKGMCTANVDTFYRGAGFKNAENGVCARRANLVA